jgi:hypothetical protein
MIMDLIHKGLHNNIEQDDHGPKPQRVKNNNIEQGDKDLIHKR